MQVYNVKRLLKVSEQTINMGGVAFMFMQAYGLIIYYEKSVKLEQS